MARFNCFEIKVFDKFIDKFAERYVQQRSYVDTAVLEEAAALNCDLNTDALISIIKSQSVFVDPARENFLQHIILKKSFQIENDILSHLRTFPLVNDTICQVEDLMLLDIGKNLMVL